MLRSKRGVSEVLGAILIALIVAAMSATYVMMEASQSAKKTMSIVDLIRAAEKRQKQLLSLTYYYKQNNSLKLYIYNYGEEDSTPKLLLVDGEIVFWRTVWTFEWYEISDSNGNFRGKLGDSTYTCESYAFDWGNGEVYGGRGDHVGYIARTTMYFKGSSTITIMTDDGMEVYIDEHSVFNGAAWRIQGQTAYQQNVPLSLGTHEVIVKWYEWEGPACSSFSATNVAPHSSISMKNMDTGATCESIPSKTLVEITLSAPASSTFDFTLLTLEGGLYSWKLTV